MIQPNSLVLYKDKYALVRSVDDKITISVLPAPGFKGGEVKAREKDVAPLHPGPLLSLNDLSPPLDTRDVPVVWELSLADFQETGKTLSLRELAELVWNIWTPRSALAAHQLLREGVYFSGSPLALQPRAESDVRLSLTKQTEKAKEGAAREAFFERLKNRALCIPEDAVFMQDVEALALGKTLKSRTMREAGLPETAAAAHKLLLSQGLWDVFVNPYPAREGAPVKPAAMPVLPPPEEERADLRELAAYAIDNAGSIDPDDALSVEEAADGACTLYVHIADPAAGIQPGSEADIEARNRGVTLYLPEGSFRMLHDDALAHYALGISEWSNALTFKIQLNADGSIAETDIFPARVRVTRFSYEMADAVLLGKAEAPPAGCEKTLLALERVAQKNLRRRQDAGAVIIEFPEAYVHLDGKTVRIERAPAFRSGDIVRECMLLAGEAAARWALARRLPFPYVSQETGDVPRDVPPGPAGAYQLRRCMRPRLLSAKPSLHWGLGLDLYTQVTSPLRRYTDLLCHQQIRALRSGRTPLNEDELVSRLAVSERGAQCAARAERASIAHWTRVFLLDKINSVWDAVVLDRKGPHATVCIPALALETQIAVHGGGERLRPGDEARIKILSAHIAEGAIGAREEE